MKIIKTKLEGVMIIEPRVFRDPRGYFMELYQWERYSGKGIHFNFVQDNLSYSTQNTLRGLHYQYPQPQAKLVNVIKGKVFDVAVDIRRGSPSFGEWEGVVLSGDNHRQLFIPEGFAHGYMTLADDSELIYLVSEFYAPDAERGVRWDDPAFGIKWPLEPKIISDKDRKWADFVS